MRFVSPRDYQLMVRLNKELINTVVDIRVLIFKLHQGLTKTNSYSEAPRKTWYPGVQVACLIERQDAEFTEEMTTIDVEQKATFNFLRAELEARNIYPEAGDFIFFDEQYYEINGTNEVQRWGGRVEYNHAVVCDAHLTRVTTLQIEAPMV